MKPTALLTIALLSSGLLVSCDKSKEAEAEKKTEKVAATPKEKADALLVKLVAGVEKTVVALESVTDKASAEAAAVKIKEAGAELSKLVPEVEVMKKELSEEDNTAMKASAEAAMTPIMGRMSEAMQKVAANPEVSEVLMPAIMEFQKAMTPPSE